MIDCSEKRNRQLAFEFRIRMFVKSVVNERKAKPCSAAFRQLLTFST